MLLSRARLLHTVLWAFGAFVIVMAATACAQPEDVGEVATTLGPSATPTPLGPTSAVPPYPTGGEFFAAQPLRYDRDPADLGDVLVVDEEGLTFYLTSMDRTLVLTDGRSLAVPADTPVHRHCASLMTPTERDALAGIEGATVEQADAYGAAHPCGVYGAVDGRGVRWMDFIDMSGPGTTWGYGEEGVARRIPLRGAAVAIDGDTVVMDQGFPVPLADDATVLCGAGGMDPQALLDEVGHGNAVYVDPAVEAVSMIECLAQD
ncbi:MAG TPA: hypothetical protein VMM13_07245 [Euzebya sp.]|nr:hypothetical protein [Euzebya sp.]